MPYIDLVKLNSIFRVEDIKPHGAHELNPIVRLLSDGGIRFNISAHP
jgi:hypothetical protein